MNNTAYVTKDEAATFHILASDFDFTVCGRYVLSAEFEPTPDSGIPEMEVEFVDCPACYAGFEFEQDFGYIDGLA